jgi:hypothetical protein
LFDQPREEEKGTKTKRFETSPKKVIQTRPEEEKN